MYDIACNLEKHLNVMIVPVLSFVLNVYVFIGKQLTGFTGYAVLFFMNNYGHESACQVGQLPYQNIPHDGVCM